MLLSVLTGHVQDRKSIEEVIRFAAAEKLVLLVDEVIRSCCVRSDWDLTPNLCSLLCIAGVPGQCVWAGQRVHLL